MDAICKFLGIWDSRNCSLHPNEVAVGTIGSSTLNAIVNASLDLIVTFTDAAEFPVKVNLQESKNIVSKEEIVLLAKLVSNSNNVAINQSINQ